MGGGTSLTYKTKTMIALIGCVKSKRNVPCKARDMYTSPLFRGRVRWAEARGFPWYILSAKYGFLDPNAEIVPYDETLNGKSDLEIRDWSKKVCITMEERGIIRKGDECVALAGANYLRYLRRRYKVHNPMEGISLFRQIATLKK